MIKVYACWSLDHDLRSESSSGGIFSELAEQIINEGYCVAGARYNKNHLVQHELINKIEDIKILRQSKYVQGKMGNIRDKMRDKKTMFVGTPCQCASINADIKVDFICKGTNKPIVYLAYLKELEETHGSKISKVWFKNKEISWNKFGTKIEFENGKVYFEDRNTDIFMRGFSNNLFMTDCCYKCKFRGLSRNTDITLGDFWGVNKSLNDGKGTSVVIINTQKGLVLFNKLKNIFKKEARIEDVIKGNKCLIKSPIKNPKSDEFMKLLETNTFSESFRKVIK